MIYDFKKYKLEFKQGALNSGYSTENILKCLNYAKVLHNNGVPIIYNLTHLSKLVGFKRNYIVQAAVVSKYSDAYYRYYKVRKKNDTGFREIKEPLPNLKDIQHWILENILYHIPPSQYAKAYIKKTGLKDNLKFHRRQKKVLSLDIENFFPSISFEKIRFIFNDVGYSEVLSTYLAKLCSLEEKLPQGAPTSPYISNLIMNKIDNRIGQFCNDLKIRYTRYSDDLTFSGDFEENVVIQFIEKLLNEEDFKLNKNKTKVMYDSQRQLVTGILVNQKIQLPKSKRRHIRQSLYHIKKYGLNSHIEKIGLNKRNYLNHLVGKIGFGLYLNPNDKELKSYMDFITKLKKESGL